MKRPDTSLSCSCTSCRSFSERPSIKKIIAQGSKIDKLYYGKYIPLRERKLLNKLVTTRAVYDDIRNEILSSSNATIDEKADLRPRKQKSRELDDAERSSAILELVNLVDKGATLGSKKLSECCSCCSCDSKSGIHEHSGRHRRHRPRHAQTHGTTLTSKSSMTTRTRGSEGPRGGKSVRFKTKHIWSDPCTCTYKLSGMIKRHSKTMIRKMRPEQPEPVMDTMDIPAEEKSRPRKRGQRLQKSYQKLRHPRMSLRESMQSFRKSIASAEKSLEKLRDHKFKDKMKAGVRRSFKRVRRQRPSMDESEEISFPKTKDSILIHREVIRRKREHRRRKCGPVCETCDPQECFRELKRRTSRRAQTRSFRRYSRETTQKKHKRGKRTGDLASRSSVSIQAQGMERNAKTRTKQQRASSDLGTKTISVAEPHISVDIVRKDKEKPLRKEQRHRTKSVKSMTTVSTSSIKPPMRSSSTETKKKIKSKEPKTSGTEVIKTKKIKEISPSPSKLIEKQSSRNVELESENRQAVRISSSFSFNIEFYKDKPSTNLPEMSIDSKVAKEKRHKLKTRDKGHEAYKTHRRHSGSQAGFKQLPKESQAGHALKRCFCTLKLKAKKTRTKVNKPSPKVIDATTNIKGKSIQGLPQSTPSITESVQTTKKLAMSRDEALEGRHHKLLPYECEPFVCVPGECDPIECEKRIRKRNMKHYTTQTNVKRSKSISSLTSKSASSATSKRIQAHSSSKERGTVKEKGKVKRSESAEHFIDTSVPQKQAVRISSTFSFSIEFTKENVSDGNIENEVSVEKHHTREKKTSSKKRDKGVDGQRKRLRHKRSQRSTSTGKSKYTLTKNNLRRCFCTLSLGKPNKPKPKMTSESRGTITSRQTMIEMPKMPPESVSRSMATDNKRNKHKLLPYECEPGVCVPGECDPYACLELIKERKRVKRHAKHSNTENRRTRSTSSLTSRSVTPSKQVQSTLATRKAKVQPHKFKEHGKATKEETRTLPGSPSRQAVRIGSSFSFNIEFFKENDAGDNEIQPVEESTPRTHKHVERIEKRKLKTRGHQGHIKHRDKSTLMHAEKEKKNALIGPAMKRCFCTLKLHKAGMKKQNPMISTGTETPTSMQRIEVIEMAHKGTKVNQKQLKYKNLEPYECEPYVCVPGECDPYECLERIKRRERRLKEFGTTTGQPRMKSTSSITPGSSFRSRSVLVHSRMKGRSTSAKRHKNRNSVSSTYRSKIPAEGAGTVVPTRQAVRIGSSFKFDIEFRKDRSDSLEQDVIITTPKESRNVKSSKKMKDKGAKVRKRHGHHQESQLDIVKKVHKGTGVGPLLKRCFCTLKLQKNLEKHHRNPQVYTVSRVTVDRTKIKTENNLIPDNENAIDSPQNALEYKSEHVNSQLNIKGPSDFVLKSKGNSNLSITRDKPYCLKPLQAPIYNKKSFTNFKINSNLSLEVGFLNQFNNFSPSCFTLTKYDQFVNKINQPKVESAICLNKKLVAEYRNFTCMNVKSNRSHIVSINRYLKRCFCTMNVQVPNRAKNAVSSASTTVMRHKLKPYECEPGICVPDECDPIECQKLIMKRLMRKASRMTGTDTRLRSSSSSTSFSTSKSRARKLQSNVKSRPKGTERRERHHETKTKQARYESAPQRTNKQAVRVGSSFSFDIEFSKGKSAPPVHRERHEYKEPKHAPRPKPVRTAKGKTRGTDKMRVNYYDQEAQSARAKAVHRGSNPMLKRCFCTLKLHKAGRQAGNVKTEKAGRPNKADQGTATPKHRKREVVKAQTSSTGQNTKPHKPHRQKLEPYECEPGVCVPGECDPYQCMELIKRRNKTQRTKGLGTEQFRTSSTSSTTAERRHGKGKQVQSKFKERDRGVKAPRSKPSHTRTIERQDTKPSRQAVRIGSSFSFDIEFFKDKSPSSYSTTVRSREPRPRPSRPAVPKAPKVPKQAVRKVKRREAGSQDSKSFRHRDSQMDIKKNQMKATMTNSFLKRCFCTAKLHGVDMKGKMAESSSRSVNVGTERIAQPRDTPSFLQRCFCVLKAMRAEKKKSRASVDVGTKPMKEKKEKRKRERRLHKLEPYECEPGICVPGECDPYVCDKIIQKRKQESKSSNTYSRTRSTSSSFGSRSSRARETQSNLRTRAKHAKQSTTQVATKQPRTQPRPERSLSQSGSSQRQAVRIGSSFSFSVEFYKDRVPQTNEVQAAAKTVKKAAKSKPEKSEPPKSKPKKDKAPKTKQKRTKSTESVTKDAALQNQELQAGVKQENKGTGVGSMLKRCFCTLKLHQKQVEEKKVATRGTKNPRMKEPQTMQDKGVGIRQKQYPHTLEPYECEPGVCIPGECDPYECEKLIRKRHMREHGTTTGRYRTKSISSSVRSSQPMHKRTQSEYKNYKSRQAMARQKAVRRARQQNVSPRMSSFSSSQRQAVRLGSNFSFDIEFYKNKAYGDNNETFKPYKVRNRSVTESITPSMKVKRAVHVKNQQSQRPRAVRNMDSQVLARRMRSTMTGVSPFLKRCFCTLQLNQQGSSDNQKNKPKNLKIRNHPVVYTLSTATYTSTRKYLPPFRKLDPYECEPGVCVPGECDPYECLARMRKRDMRSKMTGPGRGRQHSVSSSASESRKCTTSTCQAKVRSRERKQMSSSYNERPRGYSRVEYPQTNQIESSRQAVRVGSSFSFNIEFYKDGGGGGGGGGIGGGGQEPSAEMRYAPSARPYRRKKSDGISVRSKQHGKSVNTCTKDTCARQAQFGARTESRGSGVGSMLKRCFCTLKLQKIGRLQQIEQASHATATPGRRIDRYKVEPSYREIGTRTRRKTHELLPYECEPGVCIPGECDPYECYERIKRRQVKHVGTESHYASNRCVSCETEKCPNPRCRETQTAGGRYRSTSVATEQKLGPYVQKQQKEHNRQAVKIGSTFSFDIQFYKEHKEPSPSYIDKSILRQMRSNRDRLSSLASRQGRTKQDVCDEDTCSKRKYANKRTDYGNRDLVYRKSQASGARRTSIGSNIKPYTENKAMEAKNALKRCFCTLKLQKEGQPNRKVITVGRVTVEEDRRQFFKSRKHCLECEPKPSKLSVNAKALLTKKCFCNKLNVNKRISRKKNIEITPDQTTDPKKGTIKNKKDPKNKHIVSQPQLSKSGHEMETILPYVPRKFNKKVSKTLVDAKLKYGKDSNIKCQTCCKSGNSQQMSDAQFQNYIKLNKKNKKRLTAKKGKKAIQVQEIEKVKPANLKEIIFKFAQCFSKQKSNEKSLQTPTNLSDEQNKQKTQRQKYNSVNKNKKTKPQIQTDCLKTCKSDGQPTRAKMMSEPKKSKSLKISKPLDNFLCPRDCIEQHRKKFSRYQSGDTGQSQVETLVKKLTKPDMFAIDVNKVICCRVCCNEKKCKANEKSTSMPKKSVQFAQNPIAKDAAVGTKNKDVKRRKPSLKKPTTFKDSSNSCCLSCHKIACQNEGKIDSVQNKRKKSLSAKIIDGMKSTVPRNKKTGKSHPQPCVCLSNQQPQRNRVNKRLLELQLDANNMSIINREEVINRVTKYRGQNINDEVYGSSVNESSPCCTCSQNVTKENDTKCGICKIDGPMKTARKSVSSFRSRLFSKSTPTSNKADKNTKTPVFSNGDQKNIKCKEDCPDNKNKEPMFEMLVDSKSLAILNRRHIEKKVRELQDSRGINAEKKRRKSKRPSSMKKAKRKISDLERSGHGLSCPCCVCQKVNNLEEPSRLRSKSVDRPDAGPSAKSGPTGGPVMGAKLTIAAKGPTTGIFGTSGGSALPTATAKPCICGSKVCEEEAAKIIAEASKKGKGGKTGEGDQTGEGDKTGEDSKKRAQKLSKKAKKKQLEKQWIYRKGCVCHQTDCECRKAIAKEKAEQKRLQHVEKMKKIKLKKKQKKDALLEKKYRMEDERRHRERQNADATSEHQVQKFKDTHDCLLAAESVLDIAKLSCVVLSDVARSTCRAMLHPEYTYRRFKQSARETDTDDLLEKAKKAIIYSGVGSTVKRIRNRFLAMSIFKSVKDKLSENPVSNYMIHVADSDPSKRLRPKRKKKMKRRREPVDFECSLFMGSLRKKPCLVVYYMCPWFYPHCLSMLTLWRQFADVMLFLLAAVVWSPCILCMEISRACMCCVFCTQ